MSEGLASDGQNVWRVSHDLNRAPEGWTPQPAQDREGTRDWLDGFHVTLWGTNSEGWYDVNPDRCWRCDAAQGETDVGLCPTCHHDLTAG